MEERICNVCGTKYVPRESNQTRTCSRSCSVLHEKAVSRERARKWNAENRERKRKYGKEDYQKNRDRYIERAKIWKMNNPERRIMHDRYRHSKNVHGGLSEVIKEECNNRCRMCGKETFGFDAIVHHTTFIPSDHENQTLVCRSCHKTVHMIEGRWKDKQFTREEVLKALSSSRSYADAARKLGIATATLLSKRHKYGFDVRPQYGGKGGTGRYKDAPSCTE